MNAWRKKTVMAVLAMLVAGDSLAAQGGSDTLEAQQLRTAVISEVIGRFAPSMEASWAGRMQSRLAGLSESQLTLARRAQSAAELELLFTQAPLGAGTSLASFAASGRASLAMAAKPKASPGSSPTSYDDLVFTAVNPCRIYDSRFAVAPIEGSPGAPWPANTSRTFGVGPYTDYSFQGGQATSCLGSLGGSSQVAAIVGSVSTVSQTAPGYLVFYSAGGTNPNPYGVAQYYQPGVVLTSFVVMPTDLINPVYTTGFSGQASTHVIIDVVGYFAAPKAVALDCTIVNGTDTALPASSTGTNAFSPSCTAGYSKVSTYCRTNSFGASLSGFNQPADGGVCNFKNDTTSATTVRADSVCCRVPGR